MDRKLNKGPQLESQTISNDNIDMRGGMSIDMQSNYGKPNLQIPMRNQQIHESNSSINLNQQQ